MVLGKNPSLLLLLLPTWKHWDAPVLFGLISSPSTLTLWVTIWCLVVLNTYVSNPNLFSELQTLLFNCLPGISIWKINIQLNHHMVKAILDFPPLYPRGVTSIHLEVLSQKPRSHSWVLPYKVYICNPDPFLVISTFKTLPQCTHILLCLLLLS